MSYRQLTALATMPLLVPALQGSDDTGISPWVILIIILVVLFLVFIVILRQQEPGPALPKEPERAAPAPKEAPAAAQPPVAEESPPPAAKEPEPPKPAAKPEAAAPAAPAKKAKPDDLKMIEGIGPKISSVLQEAGIATFAALAGTSADRLKEILDEANIRIGDPATWPEQARLAAEGNWEGLEALQDGLKGGRRA